MKFDSLIVENALSPFRAAIGKNFDKICNDVRSLLGRVEKDIVLKDGEWKAGASSKLTRKNGESVQLPLNNPATTLLCFGMRLNELSKAGQFEAVAGIPKDCQSWVEQHSVVIPEHSTK